MIRRLLCMLGGHGKPQQTPPDNQCMVYHMCPHCGKVLDAHYEHTMGDWERVGPSAHPCEYRRNCTRCHKRPERTINHTWTDAVFLAEKDCHMEKHCTICGEEQRWVAHSWQTTSYWHGTKLKERTHCTRCGKRQ